MKNLLQPRQGLNRPVAQSPFFFLRICGQRFFTNRAQVLLLLFHALHETGGGTADEVVDFLSTGGWFSPAPEDAKAYPASNPRVPRWRMLVALAAQDAVQCGRLSREESGRWEFKRPGEIEFFALREQFRRGPSEVARGYLWTAKFKQHLDPSYQPSAADQPRPVTIYNEIQCRRMSRAYAHLTV